MNAKQRTGIIAVVIVGGLFLAVGGLVYMLIFVVGDSGPRESKEGQTWTLPDLVKHLEEKHALKPDRVAYATPFGIPLAELIKGKEVVLNVIQCENNQKAKDTAAARGKADWMAWGRFAISGNKAEVEACRKVLK
jgi:hypothetical protein